MTGGNQLHLERTGETSQAEGTGARSRVAPEGEASAEWEEGAAGVEVTWASRISGGLQALAKERAWDLTQGTMGKPWRVLSRKYCDKIVIRKQVTSGLAYNRAKGEGRTPVRLLCLVWTVKDGVFLTRHVELGIRKPTRLGNALAKVGVDKTG